MVPDSFQDANNAPAEFIPWLHHEYKKPQVFFNDNHTTTSDSNNNSIPSHGMGESMYTYTALERGGCAATPDEGAAYPNASSAGKFENLQLNCYYFK